MRKIFLFIFTIPFLGCQENPGEIDGNNGDVQEELRFERIRYYASELDSLSIPIKYRLTYYFNNGKPHRWLELDSAKMLLTDYIYEYDKDWKHIGARYIEPGETQYALEKVHFPNDSTQVTEWVDSTGAVFYTMIDDLNAAGDTYRATFKGDEVHGYDSTFYTREGFPERIFFTNTKGRVYNDRRFEYDSINPNGDWITRRKIIGDTLNEIHVREVYYTDEYVNSDGIFYEGAISTGEFSENTFSFTADNYQFFLTRTKGWEIQSGHLSAYKNGLFTPTKALEILDTIYNGAISPDGNKIIYSYKENGEDRIAMVRKSENNWQPDPEMDNTTIRGGYFYWLNNDEIFFYITENNGDIVKGGIEEDVLTITDSLTALNTSEATEFSPYADPYSRFLIFTRYLEEDKSQQGFFISYNSGDAENPNWSTPEKIEALPYGWNGLIREDLELFLFTDGNDIRAVPLKALNIRSSN